ncbi:hypothetical protein Bealeia1_01510 [Candidatus Bealeia paramacronuclearis]|uniref:Uncharacterized protein n=2 Tax=Candidatus Bealeia paramacronuclearis TaxID=1921001 RepID=A0ABZ2C4D6_9PROT|nr:hypothetical protein [Candidatus Bealeia paramacronuclearis]
MKKTSMTLFLSLVALSISPNLEAKKDYAKMNLEDAKNLITAKKATYGILREDVQALYFAHLNALSNHGVSLILDYKDEMLMALTEVQLFLANREKAQAFKLSQLSQLSKTGDQKDEKVDEKVDENPSSLKKIS